MEQAKLLEEIDLNYCKASMGKRFANYVVDVISFYILLVLTSIGLVYLRPEFTDEDDGSGIVGDVIYLICYALLMFIIEAFSRGKSLGKLITRTKAINIDGSDINFQKAFLRNIIRCIPLDVISAFGIPSNPWHDLWSHTMVIDEKLYALQRRKQVFFSELNSEKI